MAWTPSGNILQIQLSENDIHQELVWDSSEKKQYLGEDICYFYAKKYSKILTEFCFCLLFYCTLKYQNMFQTAKSANFQVGILEADSFS